jgi:transcription termination factor Rho
MSAVLDRDALAESPLADLHLIANELGVDGFRRLRRDDLIDAIIARQAGQESAVEADSEAEDTDTSEASEVEDEAARKPRRGRRGGRGRARKADADGDEDEGSDADRDRDRDRDRERERDRGKAAAAEAEDRTIEGVVELLGNGSAFVRLTPGEPTDDDVYVSAAQVKRCELVSGDRVAGPMRTPRRSERFPSLVRVDTINGRPADEVAEGTRFDELPVAWPSERLELGSDDVTLKAIEWLTPFGKGSRVAIVGGPRAGKSETVKRLVDALGGREGLEVSVVLAGVRPEEIGEWSLGPVPPVGAVSFAASSDSQAQAVEHAIEQGRRVAARGGDAVVIVDTLAAMSPHAARRVLAAARNLDNGGSLTVIATAAEPLGGETTVIALDGGLTALRRFPALDLAASGTLRPELLVGDAGAEAIARARSEAVG